MAVRNVFAKPNEQTQACLGYAMARKHRRKPKREQCGHCDRLTISQMQRKTKIYERVHINPFMVYNYLNGEFIEVPLRISVEYTGAAS